MCGRFALFEDMETIAKKIDLQLPHDFKPRYNIAPSQSILAIRSLNGINKLEFLRWGLVPPWQKEEEISSKYINARAETVDAKPMFRNSFLRRRCLILANGFYEWEKSQGKSRPWFITLKDQSVFCMAGLWEHWSHGSKTIDSCLIIVTEANKTIQAIHDRMPVILHPKEYGLWLNEEMQEGVRLKKLLKPYSARETKMREVSAKVNNARVDVPEVLTSPGE